MGTPAPRSPGVRAAARALLNAVAVLAAAPLGAQGRPPAQVQVGDLIPADLSAVQVVLSPDTLRAYVVSPAGEIWLYDRVRKTRARLVTAEAWDPSLSPTGTAMAYTRAAEKKTDHVVWVLPLDPKTGLAAGPARRVSSGGGDSPSIAPDGKSIAFARDDSTGVGQSVVVVAIGGGPERTVVRSLPSAVSNIRWTPDGKTLFFGAYPQLPCDPGWSCLALKPGVERQTGSIQRVPAAGGTATVVAVASGLWPGLSPDGTMIVYPDTGQRRQLVIADLSGRRLQTIAPPAGTIQGWIGGSTLLVAPQRPGTAVQTRP